jgi:serine/threonine-protein kinase
VQVYDVGSVDSHHFIVQELIDGENLRDYLSAQGPLTADEAIEVLLAVGGALESAADVGITHRDIKPENLMRSSRGEIKVADFGLARVGLDSEASQTNLTQAGLTLGTPRYMSPEQVQGKTVDVRSDLYSLGVSMYHLLTGRPPYEADDPIALAVMHLHETPTPLDRARGTDDLPEWLIAVVGRLMCKLPSDRYQSPTELLSAVRSKQAIADSQGAIGTAAATIRLQRVTDAVLHRKRRMVLRSVVALAVIAVTVALGTWIANTAPAQSVNRMLRPEKVAKADSIEQQYLIAVTRDDIAGWEAVGLYFPADESAQNGVYFIKSLLQLSRLHFDQGRFSEANAALDEALADPEIASKYRTVAWARKCLVLQRLNNADALAAAKRKLEGSYEELKKKNPEAVDFFKRVVPEKERLQFQLADDDGI